MGKKFNIGVIGGGMWGTAHIECLQKDGRAEVSWICTRTEQSLRQIQVKYGIRNGTLRYQDLLYDDGLDAVVIAAPPHTHCEMAVASMRAGKHVLLEKPLAVTRSEMKKIVREAEKHPDLTVLEGSCRHARLQPKFAFIKKFIESGKLGEIYHIHHNHLYQTTYIEYNPKAAWALDKKQAGGGPFFDWGEYDLSFHLGILGDEPRLKTVKSFCRNDLRDMKAKVPKADVEQHGAAYLRFDTGLTYYYERGAGAHNESACETRIYGTKGGLRFFYPAWDSKEVEYFYADLNAPHKETLTVDMSAHPNDDNIPFVAHFLDCLEGRAKPMMPVNLASKHLDIIMRILGE
ncbi:MAG: Gfo/Idh/MocA family protein [Bacillota bacterium]